MTPLRQSSFQTRRSQRTLGSTRSLPSRPCGSPPVSRCSRRTRTERSATAAQQTRRLAQVSRAVWTASTDTV
ncbi:hypothetical protein LSCM1_07051 [Leishmania martiniquensis]|uniref:Uncharacterized protein n=1 Tax=Leishmania martiniquensis TaxID=1580590 RepID=A0A836KTE5_9TRYP|nr:hypothetical protein LSCM1_07051 [Leishmania martiniquensis]